jgi:hypothetical protein
MNPLDRAARERELDAVTELQRVNLSSENRFEASPLRGNSTATGTFRRHLGVLVRRSQAGFTSSRADRRPETRFRWPMRFSCREGGGL